MWDCTFYPTESGHGATGKSLQNRALAEASEIYVQDIGKVGTLFATTKVA